VPGRDQSFAFALFTRFGVFPFGFVHPLIDEGGKRTFLRPTLLAVQEFLEFLGMELPGGEPGDARGEHTFAAGGTGIAFGAGFTLDGFGGEVFGSVRIVGERTNDIAGLRNRSTVGELGGDLEAVEILTGALAVEGRRTEVAQDLREGNLNALRVLKGGEREGLFWTAFGRADAMEALVVIAERLIFEGGRFALLSAGHDVTALFEHSLPFRRAGPDGAVFAGGTPLPGCSTEVMCFQQVRKAILVQHSGRKGLDRSILSDKELAAARRQQKS
jgi:hypothetical protein